VPLRPKATPELLDRIVANYRQTGDATNAAIRSGISVRTFFEWKARGERAKSEPFARFAQELTRAKEDAIALCLLRHKQCAEGGVFELPKHDRAGRVQRDKEGNLAFEEVLMLPNPRALAQRLSWLAPERFGPKAQVNPTKEFELPERPRMPLSARKGLAADFARRCIAFGITRPIETTATTVKPEAAAETAAEETQPQTAPPAKPRA
jgi:hypothetical protein